MTEQTKKKLFIALLINFAIVIMEIVALIMSINIKGIAVFQYYTQNSNYIAMIISAIFCVIAIMSIVNDKKIPKWLVLLRYITCTILSITLIVAKLRPRIYPWSNAERHANTASSTASFTQCFSNSDTPPTLIIPILPNNLV